MSRLSNWTILFHLMSMLAHLFPQMPVALCQYHQSRLITHILNLFLQSHGIGDEEVNRSPTHALKLHQPSNIRHPCFRVSTIHGIGHLVQTPLYMCNNIRSFLKHV